MTVSADGGLTSSSWPRCEELTSMRCHTGDEIIRLDFANYTTRIVGVAPKPLSASAVAFMPDKSGDALVFGGMEYVGLYPSADLYRWRWEVDEAQQAGYDPDEKFQLVNAYYKGDRGWEDV
jgi:hypothetical protein